ncbi:MAG TPA: MoxR family ATPase [Phycisphaerae bacterium]|nr:MoxR family ATPase [Phycisphaerae bacterium]HRR83479.1 MoxR family ATPase [Phycisphaerae bacterium]
MSSTATFAGSDKELAVQLSSGYQTILSQLERVIVGQKQVIEELMITIFARGHCLLVGVPGLAKTLLVSTLADTLDLTFKRIQFTPDLMPTDITGTEVIQDDPTTGERRFKFLRGPIFANIVLADEINRTPPKTQSALLEAMQERKISVGGVDYKLDDPFFVLATQNPIEQEGTYPLPEAQLDRFMFLVRVGYPTDEEESEIVRRMTSPATFKAEPVLHREGILAFQQLVRRVPAADAMIEYAKRLVRKTRVTEADAPDFVSKWVTWGAGPRASMNLILAAKARAILHGEAHVSWDDIRAVAKPVLRHRIILNFAAQAERISTDDIIEQLLAHVGEKE